MGLKGNGKGWVGGGGEGGFEDWSEGGGEREGEGRGSGAVAGQGPPCTNCIVGTQHSRRCKSRADATCAR